MNTTTSSIIPLLREVEMFSEFDDSVLAEFAENMKEVSLKKGETLFYKGDRESAMYVILDGSVQIHDNEYIFTTLNNKQFFGEYSLIDSAVRSASVTAVRDTHLLELEQKTFLEVTSKRPEIWKNVLIALIKRLRDYNILEEKLTMRTLQIQKKRYELEKEKETIESQKRDLEAMNGAKDKFFTIIAHDLKNPFSTVIGVSDLIMNRFNKIEKEDIYEYVQQINRFSKSAFNLLENLLQWARSQTGSIKINFKRTNIYEMVEDVIELFAVSAKQKGITFSVSIDKNFYGYVDVDMMTTVIRNLVSNAIKFSYQNGQIEVKAVETGDMVEMEVRDLGEGMDQDVLDSLFKIENRVGLHQDEDREGTGLGLILCKEFVLKNGGEIWAVSEPEKGTSFKFTLPKAL